MKPGRASAHANLTTIQAGRGLAALAVVFFHAEVTLALPKYFGRAVAPILTGGDSGVHFFFVLSGFIMALAHWEDVGRRQSPLGFFWKRVRRIYAPLWPVLTLVLVSLILVPKLSPGGVPGLWPIISAYLILPQERQSLLAVEWTLTHEIVFYLLFGLMLWRPRIGAGLLAAWFAGALLGGLVRFEFPLSFVFSPYNLLFLFGAAAAFLVSRYAIPKAALLMTCGLLVFAMTWSWVVWGHASSHDLGPILSYGLGVCLMIVGVARLELLGRARANRVFQFLGDASYSIYLVHFPIISVLAKLVTAARKSVGLPDMLWLLAVVAIATAGGMVFYLVVERTVLRIIPTRLRSWRAAADPVLKGG